ncbi:right-handed parallel beta-helix repeat-containing protein [Sphingobium sp. B2]|uniref:right-handed parallel beta-helix repeat-containing protein n=1 Tax=Sphingobium sp. B2 TaxID=2583228 RepID=UPI00119D533D|nr:right-handed parallel beta-helix repeat-containing protein [Sphingobium sp. B2]
MTANELKAALAKCTGGEVIDLDGAALGKVLLKGYAFDKAVSIVNGALSFDVRGCRGLHFEGVTLGTSVAGYASTAISARRVKVSSPDATALTFHNIADGFVENSEFFDCNLALALRSCSNFNALRNRFHDIRKDGIRIQEGADGLMIDGNHFWDFYPGTVGGEATHPDAIQGATDAVKPTRGVTISNNRIWRGAGQAVQGIFCRTYAGRLNYEGLSIRHNVLHGTLYNGIAFTGSGAVERNTLIGLQDQKTWMRWGAWDGPIAGNFAPTFNQSGKIIAAPAGNWQG